MKDIHFYVVRAFSGKGKESNPTNTSTSVSAYTLTHVLVDSQPFSSHNFFRSHNLQLAWQTDNKII